MNQEESLKKIRAHLAKAYDGQYKGKKGRKAAMAGQVWAALNTANVALGRKYDDVSEPFWSLAEVVDVTEEEIQNDHT